MDRYLKTRIESITESDFWGSISSAGPSKPAVQAGRAGKREQAYRLLGAFHATALADVAADLVKSVEGIRHDASATRELRERVDLVVAHDIQGWHTTRIKFGKRIDFNADFGRSGQYGFHYLGWLHPVIRQYALTRETKYRNAFVDILKQYYDQRTKLVHRIPNLHPVYYELGARAKSQLILPAYALLAGDDQLDTDAREAMLKLLMGFGRSLFRLQNTGFRAGNWQIVGAQSLFMIGANFPEWREAASWRERGMSMVTEHLKRDFFDDGGHGERCWGYGYMSLDGMIGFYESAKRCGYLKGAKLAEWERFIRRGLQWFAATTSPNRYMLAYGDGGLGSADGIFKRAVELFPDFAKAPGLLGVDRSRSSILRPSGYAFMRGGDRPDAPFLSVNFGKTGGGHTHSDLLDFSMWCFGRPLIEEVGRWGSYDNALEPMFRSERSHNQVTLDHVVMDRHKHEAHDVCWHADDRVTAFSAWHEAYSKARLTRQIVMIDRQYFFVFDLVTSKEYIFQATNWLHAPRAFASAGPGRWITQSEPGKAGCLVVAGEHDAIRRTAMGVDYSDKDYLHATRRGEAYDFNKERHFLAVSKWCDVGAPRPITFGTLLAPFAKRSPVAKIVPAEVSSDGTARAFDVHVRSRRDLLIFNPKGDTIRYAGKRISAPIAVRIGHTWIDLKMK